MDHEGRKARRFFKQLPDAETFQRTHNANPLLVGELLERKTELLYCLERLKSMQVTLPEVVDYYLHHRANKGNPTLEELVDTFLDEKKRLGRSKHYDLSMRYSLASFMDAVGKDGRVGDITRQQIADYVYGKAVGDVTKRGILPISACSSTSLSARTGLPPTPSKR